MLGALFITVLPQWLSRLGDIHAFVFAAALIAAVILLPEGLWRSDPQLVARAVGEMTIGTQKADSLLQVAEVSHRFGGLHVLRGVEFGVPAGSLTGLIGPNGAGKSTLFNIISGFLSPQSGTVRFDGRDITRDPVQTRTRAGLVRTFQTPKVFGKLSVRENLMIGCYRHLASGVVGNMLCSRRSRVEMEMMHAQAAEAGERLA